MRCVNAPWNWCLTTIGCICSIVWTACSRDPNEQSLERLHFMSHGGVVGDQWVFFHSQLQGPRWFRHFVWISASRRNEATGVEKGTSFLFETLPLLDHSQGQVGGPHPMLGGDCILAVTCPAANYRHGHWERRKSARIPGTFPNELRRIVIVEVNFKDRL